MISTMVANLELSIKTTRPNSTNLQLAALTVADILLMILVGKKILENFFYLVRVRPECTETRLALVHGCVDIEGFNPKMARCT